MKLYELPRYSIFRIIDDDPSTKYKLHNIDGMYSYCTNIETKEVTHVLAWQEVELIEIT